MKLVRTTKNRMVFQLGKRERRLLLELFKLYPVVPPAHRTLSKQTRLPDHKANQQLLDEALAEQRVENKKLLAALLANPRRWRETETGQQFTLSPSEVEWVLQVLNDIRVGSWILLGSPEEGLEVPKEEMVPHLWAMEMAGYFQMRLLEAVGGA